MFARCGHHSGWVLQVALRSEAERESGVSGRASGEAFMCQVVWVVLCKGEGSHPGRVKLVCEGRSHHPRKPEPLPGPVRIQRREADLLFDLG